MKADLLWIIDHADAVYFLPGSADSKGCRAERALAECLNIPIVEIQVEEAIL
jgi:hypothetical protein